MPQAFSKKTKKKNRNYEFDFNLIPIKYDEEQDSIFLLPENSFTNKDSTIEVRSEVDKVLLKVTNKGTKNIQIKILEIDFMGNINEIIIISFLHNLDNYISDNKILNNRYIMVEGLHLK